MQGKGGPLDVDVKLILQFFNTPGDEIAPGSDVIGENFQFEGIFHFVHFSLCKIFCLKMTGVSWFSAKFRKHSAIDNPNPA
jgi:hypothetical protein